MAHVNFVVPLVGYRPQKWGGTFYPHTPGGAACVKNARSE